ncbi:MAG: outer membrane beta-barrel protein [Sphingomonadaceae bacterium]
MKSQFRLATAAAAAVIGLAGAASAEPFNGPYIGGQIGWQKDKASIDVGPGKLTDNQDAFTGGVFAGYDAKLSENFVLGGEVGFDLGGKTSDRYDIKPRNTINVSARAGVLASPQTLIYARGGYASGRYRFFNSDADRFSTSRDGWQIGAGVEHAFTDNISSRIEYRYSDFGDPSNRLREAGYNLDDASLKRHQVTLGVAYRF